jgi:hypothetical protein
MDTLAQNCHRTNNLQLTTDNMNNTQHEQLTNRHNCTNNSARNMTASPTFQAKPDKVR